MEEFSYAHNPDSGPRSYCSIQQHFKKNATKHPDLEFLIHRHGEGKRTSITYKDFYDRATMVGKYLVGTGTKPGDTICIIGPNTINWAIANVGILCAGAITVNATLGTQTGDDLKEILTLSKCKGIICDETNNTLLEKTIENLVADKVCEFAICISKKSNLKFKNIDDIIEEADFATINLPVVYPEDPALIFSTSGSTGKPKLILHSHYNMQAITLESFIPFKDFNQRKTWFNDRPFAFVGGSPLLLCASKLVSSRVIYDPPHLTSGSSSCKEFLKVLEEEKCTDALIPPAVLTDIVSEKAFTSKSFCLESIITGGQMVDPRFAALIGTLTEQFAITYGSSETLIGTEIVITTPEDAKNVQVGQVGKAMKGVEVRVVDQYDKTVPLNTTGSIQFRNRFMLLEYFGNKEATDQAFVKGGWFRLGDVGKMIEGGRLILSGRDKDIISRGTRKIIPGQIEDVVRNISGIKDVSVVPVPDTRLGEEVCVCFVVADNALTPIDIEAHCSKHFVSGEKAADGIGEMPRYFLKFDSFPLVTNGKTDKNKLNIMAKDKLNLV